MKKWLIVFSFVLLGACGNEARLDSEVVPAERSDANETSTVQPRLVDGVQVVEIEAGSSGYTPDRIAVETGVPVRLVFTRTADAPCIESVRVPEYGVQKTVLPMGAPRAIEFTPDEGGEFTFVCGMGMQKGTLVVSS